MTAAPAPPAAPRRTTLRRLAQPPAAPRRVPLPQFGSGLAPVVREAPHPEGTRADPNPAVTEAPPPVVADPPAPVLGERARFSSANTLTGAREVSA